MPQFLQTSDTFFINVDEIHSAQVNPDGSVLLGVHGAEKQVVKGDYAAELVKTLGGKKDKEQSPAAKPKDK